MRTEQEIKIFTRKEIREMTIEEFEMHEKDILKQMAEGATK